MSEVKKLIAEARTFHGSLVTHDAQAGAMAGFIYRLANALEDTERLRLEASQEERRHAATVERVRGLLGELDLDSGRVTAPGTAWGSILREARETLEADAPSSDDTEWEYGARSLAHPTDPMAIMGKGAADQLNLAARFTVMRRTKEVPAGPWVAIEKGGESNG